MKIRTSSLSVIVKRLFSKIATGIDEKNEIVNNLFSRLRNGERSALARSITLVESSHTYKKEIAQKLLQNVLQNARLEYATTGFKSLSFRIGISGPPGAGKSTFLEAIGKHLTGNGHKVAVLAVDPSSLMTGGSLLGDKVRMPDLSCDPNAYIRPSPTCGHLGGVTRSTHEAITLCECAGYNIIFVETVGVGQSEYHVAGMVDAFLLLLPPASGDELQGIKKGIVELADIIAINKADGDFLPAARRIQAEYTSALKFSSRKNSSWKPKVMRLSSKTKEGLPELWAKLEEFWNTQLRSGELENNRKGQYVTWMWHHIEAQLKDAFSKDKGVQTLFSDLQQKVLHGDFTPGMAADILMEKFMTGRT